MMKSSLLTSERGRKRSHSPDTPSNDLSRHPPRFRQFPLEHLKDLSVAAPARSGPLSGISAHPEIFLTILSFLSARDLVLVERVCTGWRRAGLDGQLWKSIYLSNPDISRHASPSPNFSRTTSRRSESSFTPTPSRFIHGLGQWLAEGHSSAVNTPDPREVVEDSSRHFGTGLGDHLDGDQDGTEGSGRPSRSLRGSAVQTSKAEAREDGPPVRLFAPLPSRASSFITSGVDKPEEAKTSTNPTQMRTSPIVPPGSQASSVPVAEGSRGATEPSSPSPGIDWKRLVRVGTNWSNGNARLTRLSSGPSVASTTMQTTKALGELSDLSNTGEVGSGARPSGDNSMANFGQRRDSTSASSRAAEPRLADKTPIPIMAISPNLVFVAYVGSPLVHVYSSGGADNEEDDGKPIAEAELIIPPPPGWSSPSRPDVITAIAVDDAVGRTDCDVGGSRGSTDPSLARLTVWYASGGWVVLEIDTSSSNLTWHRTYVQRPPNGLLPRRNRRQAHAISAGDRFLLGKMHWPIVIGCTKAFYISVWRLRVESGGEMEAVLLSTLHSPVSSWPATIRLNPLLPPMDGSADTDSHQGSLLDVDDLPVSTEHRFRASLAYCTPLYPQSWTVAVQDILINLPLHPILLTPAAQGTVAVERNSHVQRSSGGYGSSWLGKRKRGLGWVGRGGTVVGVKGEEAVGIGLDEKWCVLAGQDDQVQVYSMPPSPGLQGRLLDLSDDQQDGAECTLRSNEDIEHSQTLLAHASATTSLAVSEGRCVTSGGDGRLLVWDLNQEAMLRPIEEDGEGNAAGEYVGWREKADLEAVEIRTGGAELGGYSPSGAGTTRTEGRIVDRTAEDSVATMRALRQSVLPIPPVVHPLSLAAAARDFRFSEQSRTLHRSKRRRHELDQEGEEDEAGPGPGVRGLSFNEEMIVGVIPASGRDGQDSVRIWKFDI